VAREGFSGRIGDAIGEAIDSRMEETIRQRQMPQHVAIIMDGNRRFAWSARLPAKLGHRKGKEKLEEVMDWVLELGIPYLTVYALSTENILTRKPKELDTLFDLYVEGLNDIASDQRIHDRRVRVQAAGNLNLLPQRVLDAIAEAESMTEGYDGFVFTVCLAYGSREEIVEAVRTIAAEHAAGDLPLDEIDEETVSHRLWTAGLPDPDLVIRTSGEERISNFLLWQMAYSELYFSDVFWPSFSRRDLLKAIAAFQKRGRRYGE